MQLSLSLFLHTSVRFGSVWFGLAELGATLVRFRGNLVALQFDSVRCQVNSHLPALPSSLSSALAMLALPPAASSLFCFFVSLFFFLFLPQLLFALRFEVLPQMVWQQQTRRTTAATAATTTEQQQQQISTTRVARDFD